MNRNPQHPVPSDQPPYSDNPLFLLSTAGGAEHAKPNEVMVEHTGFWWGRFTKCQKYLQSNFIDTVKCLTHTHTKRVGVSHLQYLISV